MTPSAHWGSILARADEVIDEGAGGRLAGRLVPRV